MTQSENALNTLKEICAYTGKSEKTVRKLIRHESFPASLVCGQWLSDKKLIDQWRVERCKGVKVNA